jgi:hypothetical protein
MKWVKINKYCEISGDTATAVHTRRKKGIWLDGVQCRLGPDGNLWVNLAEVDKWVEKGKQATSHKLCAV